jgi:hypothetical protein
MKAISMFPAAAGELVPIAVLHSEMMEVRQVQQPGRKKKTGVLHFFQF